MPLDLLRKEIRTKYRNIHSCIVSDKKSVLSENYFEGKDGKQGYREFTQDDLHELRSGTKSIASIAIGICLDNGFIESLDTSITDYLSEYEELLTPEWNQINIRNLLTMTSGIKWTQSGTRKTDDIDSETEMEQSDSPIEFILSQPIEALPNTKFIYNSGNTVLLGKIVEKVSDQNFNDFIKKYLFEPLGIKTYKWWDTVDKTFWTHAGLSMRPIDMCKIGQMLLSNGTYKSERVISPEYISEMSSVQEVNKGYGYHFWRKTFGISDRRFHSYFAAGNGGQYIFVFPFDDLTVVFTGGNYHSDLQNQPHDILQEEILSKL